MPNNINILRLKDVCNKVGLSKSSIYSGMINNKFPKTIKLGIRAVGWKSTDIEEWIQERTHDSV